MNCAIGALSPVLAEDPALPVAFVEEPLTVLLAPEVMEVVRLSPLLVLLSVSLSVLSASLAVLPPERPPPPVPPPPPVGVGVESFVSTKVTYCTGEDPVVSLAATVKVTGFEFVYPFSLLVCSILYFRPMTMVALTSWPVEPDCHASMTLLVVVSVIVSFAPFR